MKKISLLASSVACVLSTSGFAQTIDSAATTAPQASETDSGLGEIVVTATRRATNLQETPIAVSAIDQAAINSAAPRDIGDLARFVPNFSAAKITGFNAASFAIRGTSQTSILVYNEPPVAVVVDDFVVPHVQSQLLDTFDLEQLEVLRGPQGTLFGKNTTGGAVVVHTKKPSLTEFGAQVQAQYGSFNNRQLQAAINVPIVDDRLGLRLVGSWGKSDGYMRLGACYGPITPVGTSPFAGQTGCGSGKRHGGEDAFYGRAKLLWEPTDNIRALLQYERVRDHSDTPVQVNETPIGDPAFTMNRLGFTQDAGDPIKNGGLTLRSDALIDMDKGQRVFIDGYYLNVDWDVPFGTFSSVTGHRKQRSRLPQSSIPENAPLSLFDYDRQDNRRTWQQEWRFASKLEGPFQFVAGAFYQHDSVDYCVAQVLGYQDLLGQTTPYGAYNDNPLVLCSKQRARSYAGYIEGNYEITDRLTLTAGARYTNERKFWAGRHQIFVQMLSGVSDPGFTWRQLGNLLDAGDFERFPFAVLSDRRTWKQATWRGSLSYKVNDDVFSYFTYSRGFKSGAYGDSPGSSGAPLVPAQIKPTNPETADSFELGVKAEAFDRRLRFNLAGFHVTYKDAQRQVVVPVTRPNGTLFQETRFFNAAKAIVKGIEAEATAIPVEGLTLRGILGYQEGKYKEFASPVPTGRNLADTALARTPKWQATGGINYALPVGDVGKVVFDASVAHESRNLFTLDVRVPTNDAYLDAHTLINGSIGFTDAGERYQVRIIGRNLGNQRYRTGSQTVGSLFRYSIYGEPRYYGLEIGVKFGGAR
ncbi:MULTISPECIES: TonB-dependent receptor [unclassified Sphingomonas]|uniref:TonB-dependent receptor n=1 Tax=unclassified Sphingomonas TaxID=196159 RepID=UPI00070062B2|nr:MULTISPECIES: TonB-dependent receptor [unclassified Sphingomonas]KQX23402.1 TonB-dependent receptor [Sphingomonas sp. Root1294]KQY68253.1 TonB-dependent receptor [Sphingomonas sp. Root50]KRB91150.1 TonB-dependent receptor [Sphingomonas sp. Root720]